jgi:phytoene dehydrogenase-like protein
VQQRPLDLAVIGAGFGGLGAALAAAERGASVAVYEALNYPGGCASTFSRDGFRFEAGATLFSGLRDEQLFGAWSKRHGFALAIDWLDPLVELRAPSLSLPVARSREAFAASLERLPGAPIAGLRAFFARQEKVASALWALFDDPSLLPPLSAGSLLRHLARAPRYAGLLPLLGKPVGALLEEHGLARFEPLRLWLDAVCQITVQCSAAEAEAPFALSAADYFWRGTGHVRGGIGVLATGLCEALAKLGAQVRLGERVRSLRRDGPLWRLQTRRGELLAKAVVANVLPGALRALLGEGAPAAPAQSGASGASPGGGPSRERSQALAGLAGLESRLAAGWGAVMLYRVLPAAALGPQAHHLQLIDDACAPLQEGNHVFASLGALSDAGRAPPGLRTLTVSTHVPLAKLQSLAPDGQGAYVEDVQERMRRTLLLRAPELCQGVVHELTASPRTFARFTRRDGGAVGGIPRRAGLAHYRQLGPLQLERGLWLVGDSVFPGQSTYATAIGGVRTAEAIARGR